MHPLTRLARAITDNAYPEEIRLYVGLVTKHPDGRTVKIVEGQFYGRYGLSNFWCWREVLPDGSLSEKLEHGYGWAREN